MRYLNCFAVQAGALLISGALFMACAQTTDATTPPTGAAPPAAAPQTPAPAPAPAPAAPAPPTWSIGLIDFSGLVDGYYSYNFNHPADRNNALYNFDVKNQQFSLNMAKLSLSHSPDPIGFQVDLGFGRAFDIVHSTEKAPEIFRYIEQAYVSFKPAKAGGVQFDFGEFVTSAGAEVIESHSNWNYSRSLLFAYAIPYYHFGLRTSFPVGKHFTGGVQVVNGWNNIEDNNSGKTVGLTGTFTYTKWSWANNYYVGPEKDNTNKGLRNLWDSVLTLTPNPNVSAYINFDYGRDKNVGPGSMSWVGIAGALQVHASPKVSFTPRFEWFKDKDGFMTGHAQSIKEFTLTGEYKWVEGLLSRLEYRRDFSDFAFYEQGSIPGKVKNQDTLTVAVIGFFGPKR